MRVCAKNAGGAYARGGGGGGGGSYLRDTTVIFNIYHDIRYISIYTMIFSYISRWLIHITIFNIHHDI